MANFYENDYIFMSFQTKSLFWYFICYTGNIYSLFIPKYTCSIKLFRSNFQFKNIYFGDSIWIHYVELNSIIIFGRDGKEETKNEAYLEAFQN